MTEHKFVSYFILRKLHFFNYITLPTNIGYSQMMSAACLLIVIIHIANHEFDTCPTRDNMKQKFRKNQLQ